MMSRRIGCPNTSEDKATKRPGSPGGTGGQDTPESGLVVVWLTPRVSFFIVFSTSEYKGTYTFWAGSNVLTAAALFSSWGTMVTNRPHAKAV